MKKIFLCLLAIAMEGCTNTAENPVPINKTIQQTCQYHQGGTCNEAPCPQGGTCNGASCYVI